MAEQVGALIVELRANAVHFQAEMEKARKSTRRSGEEFELTNRRAASFANEGLRQVADVSPQLGHLLADMSKQSSALGQALQLAGKASVLFAVGIAAFELTSKIRDFLVLGESAESYAKKLEDARAAQDKFAAQTLAGFKTGLSFRKEIEQLRGQAASAGAALVGDAEGAARTRLTSARAMIALERQQRELDLRAQGLREADLSRALIDLDRVTVAKRQAAQLDYAATVKKLQDTEREQQITTWTQETNALRDQLKERIQARQQFEAQLGQGAVGLGLDTSAAGGVARLRQIQESIKKAAADQAFLEREGLLSQTDAVAERERLRRQAVESFESLRGEFRAVPAVVEAAQRAIDAVEFGNFGAQVAEGRKWVDEFIKTTDELRIGLGDLNERLAAGVRAGVDKASPAVQQLTADYLNLASAIFSATSQLTQYQRVAGE